MDINDGAKTLRERMRLLERELGILEKSEVTCCGVTFAQCHAIVEIGRAGNISLNDLAAILNLDKSTMSKTVNNLVVNELATRELDAGDRRYVTINLTDSGRKIFEGIEEAMNIYYKKTYRLIPEDKRQQVVESLDILLGCMKKDDCCKGSCCE